jgi:TetR/AcrR family acrAB operon transcriptional repressor
MARRTKEEAQETRNHILDVAEQIFHEKGVSRTSLADIAAAAGVTRGAIYWHFENKADLFTAMMDRVKMPIEETAQAICQGCLTDPLAHVRTCVFAILRRIGSDQQCRRVFEIAHHKCELVEEMVLVRDRHVESRNSCMAEVEQRLRDAQRDGILAEDVKPKRAALTLFALVDGLIYNWVLDPEFFSLAREGERIVGEYLDSLRGEEGTITGNVSKARKPDARSINGATAMAGRRRRQ